MMLQRSTAAVAIVFGIVTLVVGVRVLSGADPGYPVFRPLLIFNVVMGVVYVLAGLRAWRDHRRGRAWAGGITLLNLVVLLVVLGAYATGAGVASQSLAAMSVRTLVWGSLFLALSRVTRRVGAAQAGPDDDAWVVRPVEDAPITIAAFYAVDHDDIDRLLGEFRTSRGGEKPAALDLYREFKARLERHIGWEENILFPLFERLSGLVDNGPTGVMRSEHRTITALLDSIDTTLGQGEANIDADEAELLEVLASHNWKEENILYPLIDRQVSVTDREAVFARMRAEAGGA